MSLGQFMAAGGIAQSASMDAQRQLEQDANRRAEMDLRRQYMQIQQQDAAMRAQEQGYRMRALQRGETDVAKAEGFRDDLNNNMPAWGGAAAAQRGINGESAAAPAAAPPAAGAMPPGPGPTGEPIDPSRPAISNPDGTPGPAAPAGTNAPAKPGGKPTAMTSADLIDEGEARRQYELAIKHKMPEAAMAIRAKFAASQRARLLDGLWHAVSKAEASGNPQDVVDVYNKLYPDGQELKVIGRDESNGNVIVEHSNGKKGSLSLQAIAQRIFQMSNGPEAEKVFGKILEEGAKGVEARKGEVVKGTEARKTKAQEAGATAALQVTKDAEALKRTKTTAGATVTAADIAGKAGIKRAEITASRPRAGAAGLTPDKAATEASRLVNERFKSPIAQMDPKIAPVRDAQIARAAALARAGWTPQDASEKARQDWEVAVAAAGKKGPPRMPTDIPPPPVRAVAGAPAPGGVDDDLTADDDED